MFALEKPDCCLSANIITYNFVGRSSQNIVMDAASIII